MKQSFGRSWFIGDDWLHWGVDHGGIVDGGKEAINKVKLVFTKKNRPNGLHLQVSKILSNTTMTTWIMRGGRRGGYHCVVCYPFAVIQQTYQ